MVQCKIEYKGDLRCEAMHGPSRTVLSTDAPVDNQGKGESFSPTDLVATALGACMMTIMGIAARRENIPLQETSVHVEKHMSTDAPRRISKIVVRFDLTPGIPAAKRQALERAAQACPVAKSLHPDVEVLLSFHYPD